jgi:hypothetical protein
MRAEVLLAAIGLTVCLVLLARLALGARRRERIDGAVFDAARRLRAAVQGRWRQRRLRGQVRREASDLIERARRGDRPAVGREGNVYRPRSFDRGGDGEREPPDGRNRRDH